jgi:AAA ATPase domain
MTLPIEPMKELLKAEWQLFLEALQRREQGFLDELAGAWNDASALLTLVRETFTAWQGRTLEAGSFEAVWGRERQAGGDLLEGPLSQYQGRRPVRRVLSAIEEDWASIEELVRPLPDSVPCTGRRFLSLVGSSFAATWVDSLASWRSRGQKLPLRSMLVNHLHREVWGRSRLDASFQLLLAEACFALREPWHIYRALMINELLEVKSETQELKVDWDRWVQRSSAMQIQAFKLLEEYQTWVGDSSKRLARAIYRGSGGSRPGQARPSKLSERLHQKNLSFWAKQQRALAAVLDLELRIHRLESQAVEITAGSLNSLRRQHEELKHGLEGMLRQLDTGPGASLQFDPPRLGAPMRGLKEQVDQWAEGLSEACQSWLPETVEIPATRWRLPLVRRVSRSVEPQKVFSFAVENFGKPVLAEAIAGITETDFVIAREMEHAREVVEYGIESAKSGEIQDKDLLVEAVVNARSLLEEQARATVDLDLLDRKEVESLAGVFLETHSEMEVSRVGLLAHLTRLRGRRALNQLAEYLQMGSRRLESLARGSLDRFWVKIGWRLPARPALKPVIRRAHLKEVLQVKVAGRELPPLYRRLFRLDPIEDPRFLIGREEELRNFGEALQGWESGQFAAILLVGARGSGKTSLLNCARSSVLADRRLVVGSFSQRLTTPEQIQAFLQELLQIPGQASLESALAEGRRVVILEELERTFLRTARGFEGLRTLLEIIHPTCRSTLWILSLNDRSFQYLDVAVDLGRFFSHRINAMSVKQDDLATVILQRHNLSGLRLKFAPPPPEDPRMSRIRSWLGLQRDAQRLFFEALYEQSSGVFRSAFKLWQDCIENVEAGVVELGQPLAPDYSGLRAELAQMDCFTLVALQQHGSLTEGELAQVFCEPVETSRVRLGRLLELEILEHDPVHPGIRIRPEARHFVQDTLHRANLL